MKKMITAGTSFVLALMLSVSAFAMEVPTRTVVQNLNGVQQYIKTYTVSADLDPQELIEEPFEYEGYVYTFADITKHENDFQAQKEHTETITVETKKKDLSEILDVLDPTMEYDDGRYSGVLALDHTTIKTEPAGYTSGSYTVRTTKEIGNLDSNDMAYVPATTVKDGVTIQLESVDWQVQSTALVDDVLVPSSYVAVATYAGKASYSTPTGYITTADYVGTVSCEEIKDVTYTVLYVGAASSLTSEVEDSEAPSRSLSEVSASVTASKAPYFIGGGVALALIGVGAYLLLRARQRRYAGTDYEDTTEMEDIEHETGK
ncbi:MAG: hypothetical protein IJV64_09320 [Oscillospiraceae bacterium]|nr:hypothetical protein [Oscillospiraceae bacterium]